MSKPSTELKRIQKSLKRFTDKYGLGFGAEIEDVLIDANDGLEDAVEDLKRSSL